MTYSIKNDLYKINCQNSKKQKMPCVHSTLFLPIVVKDSMDFLKLYSSYFIDRSN